MTPKEKAEELIKRFMEFAHADWNAVEGYDKEGQLTNAKKCALIVADELMLEAKRIPRFEYWMQVEKEIKNYQP